MSSEVNENQREYKMNIQELVADYIGKRDTLAAKRKAFEEYETAVKKELEAIEACIMDISHDTGVDSFKTPCGTAFRTTKTFVNTVKGDWDKFANYVLKTGDIHLLEKRPAKLAVLELLKDNPELTPDELGLEVVSQSVIQFRK
jgi:hypothetical protein